MDHAKQIDDLAEALASTESELRDAREALARVEAERDSVQIDAMSYAEQRDTEHAQMADVLYILDQHRAWTGMGWEQLPVPVHAVEKIRSKMAQAEQRKAREPVLARPEHGASLDEAMALTMDRYSGALNQLAVIEQQEAQGAQAGEFQREDRYIVIKRKDLEKAPTLMAYALQVALDGLREHLPKREHLVIESDWPEYEPTWAAIQARVTCQGGDERSHFEKWFFETNNISLDEYPHWNARDELGEYRSGVVDVAWGVWQARAALATQPAAGEPVGHLTIIGRPPFVSTCFVPNGLARELNRGRHALYAAPPAAAHGDEAVRALAGMTDLYSTAQDELDAVRRDAERYRWLRDPAYTRWGTMFKLYRAGAELDEAIDAAMREQGDGEVE